MLLGIAAAPASAETIIFPFSGDPIGPFGGIGADTFNFTSVAGTVTLNSAAPINLTINYLNWAVNDSGQLTTSGDFDISRGLTLAGVYGTIVQSAHLDVTPAEDTLTGIGGMVSTVYNLGSNGVVVVTARGFRFSATVVGSFGGNADVSLQWTPASVPEPPAIVLVLAGIGLIAASSVRLRRQRH
jgi:hypothetical protein